MLANPITASAAPSTFAEVMRLTKPEFYHTERALNHYTATLTLDVFQRMGVFGRAGETYFADHIEADLRILPLYGRMFNALLDLLERHGYISQTGTTVRTLSTVDNPDTRDAIDRYRRDPKTALPVTPAGWSFIEGNIQLQTMCFEAMPDVLTGRRTYIDVMFPNGDMSLVSAIYKSTVQEYMNRQTARRVRELAAQKIALYGSATLLEVGAGTGSTTAIILRELETFGLEQLTYWYTDISAGFTRVGKREFGTRYPFIRPKILDIGHSPLEQGFEANMADIVVCNNVLHATKNMHDAVAHATELLRADGHLVVNDITRRLDFITVTFGLTHDWWSYADPECRVTHTPVITGATWRALLARSGYAIISIEGVPDMPEDQLHQSLIIASAR